MGKIPSHIVELNKKHAVVIVGGKTLILNEFTDPVWGYKSYNLSSPTDFRHRYGNQYIRNGNSSKTLSKAWLDHPGRRQYEGIVFAPGKNLSNHYNLWQGFAVEPKSGDCFLYLDHLLNNICSSDEDLYEYVLGWMAHTVQHPENRIGVSIVLRGKQGTGKGIVVTEFGQLFGPHFVHIRNDRHLTGNFNGHLERAVVVFADEAFWAGDKAAEGALKGLITEEQLPIEYKGRDVILVKNHIHLLVASNQDWVVPAGFEERRFFLIDVSEARMQDHSYFAAVVNQMNNGGREALLHYLLNYDLTGINLRVYPQSEALMENKFLSMSPSEKFWYERLMAGSQLPHEDEWQEQVSRNDLHDEYIEFAKKTGQSRRSTQTELGIALKKLCPGIRSAEREVNGKRQSYWEFPDLATCRGTFDRATKYYQPWPKEPEADGTS